VGVTVTGLANLAVKVADLDQACAFYESVGAQVRNRMLEFMEQLGPSQEQEAGAQ
jgi:hypothetical protein